MSKHKSKRSGKQQNSRYPMDQGEERRLSSRIWKKAVSVFVGASAIASLISFLLSFLPQVSVRPEGRLEPQNPFSTPFVINNSGLTSINDVTFVCRLRHAINDKGGKIIAYEKGVRPFGFKISQITPGESSTVGLPFTWIGGTTVSADFDFTLEYRPSYYPLKKLATFRFATARQHDGTLVWLPRAQSEP
jgi:hypothetical protein